jgi:hypothetical protein
MRPRFDPAFISILKRIEPSRLGSGIVSSVKIKESSVQIDRFRSRVVSVYVFQECAHSPTGFKGIESLWRRSR